MESKRKALKQITKRRLRISFKFPFITYKRYVKTDKGYVLVVDKSTEFIKFRDSKEIMIVGSPGKGKSSYPDNPPKIP